MTNPKIKFEKNVEHIKNKYFTDLSWTISTVGARMGPDPVLEWNGPGPEL